jgi:hypothetical protein
VISSPPLHGHDSPLGGSYGKLHPLRSCQHARISEQTSSSSQQRNDGSPHVTLHLLGRNICPVDHGWRLQARAKHLCPLLWCPARPLVFQPCNLGFQVDDHGIHGRRDRAAVVARAQRGQLRSQLTSFGPLCVYYFCYFLALLHNGTCGTRRNCPGQC